MDELADGEERSSTSCVHLSTITLFTPHSCLFVVLVIVFGVSCCDGWVFSYDATLRGRPERTCRLHSASTSQEEYGAARSPPPTSTFRPSPDTTARHIDDDSLHHFTWTYISHVAITPIAAAADVALRLPALRQDALSYGPVAPTPTAHFTSQGTFERASFTFCTHHKSIRTHTHTGGEKCLSHRRSVSFSEHASATCLEPLHICLAISQGPYPPPLPTSRCSSCHQHSFRGQRSILHQHACIIDRSRHRY